MHALGIRSCCAHVEFYKTKKGFVKIVEIGARIGGYRDEMYFDAHGIRHGMNDLLIHLGEKPLLKPTKKKHTVFMKFWPRKKGVLKSIKGIKKIREFPFVVRTMQKKVPGEKVGLSKYGHLYICAFNIIADTRTELLANIRKVEKTLEIVLK